MQEDKPNTPPQIPIMEEEKPFGMAANEDAIILTEDEQAKLLAETPVKQNLKQRVYKTVRMRCCDQDEIDVRYDERKARKEQRIEGRRLARGKENPKLLLVEIVKLNPYHNYQFYRSHIA